ncbi:MAG: hypothetical protein ACRDG7_06115 [Candidatus Limnocylindria bacterium]
MAGLSSRRSLPLDNGQLARPLRQLGLARLLRIGVTAAIPALWYEIVVLHFRGSFQSRVMWPPVAALPAVLVGGAVSSVIRDDVRSRALFRPLAWLLAAVGLIGTAFHLRGVSRQMGGLRNWHYNFATGPPLPAPPQVALFGLLGIVAAAPRQLGETGRLVAWARTVNVASYALLAIEAGYGHWLGGFFNRLMFTPLVLSPLAATLHVGAAFGLRPARRAEGAVSIATVVAGLIGFAFHVRNVLRRQGGITWQNLFYGPPLVAPLQLTSQGVLGVLAALFDRRR